MSDLTVFKRPSFSFEAIFFVLLGAILIVAGWLELARPDIYRAVLRVKVSPPAFPGPWFPQTEFEVISSDLVLGKTVEKLHLADAGDLRGSPNETLKLLRRQMDLSVIPRTGLVELKVRNRDPVQAAKIANTVAETFQEFRWNKNRRLKAEEQDGVVNIVDLASVPSRPIAPNRPLGATAFLFGSLLVIVGVLLEASDRSSSRSEHQNRG